MGNFNRGGRQNGGFERRSFNDRGSRGSVQMHQAVCDNCGKNCEVPFKPTSGKPVFCSNCFENKNSSQSNNFDDRQMFDAVCDDCGNNCKVPFRPSGDKPIYCNNCFGDKKEGGDRIGKQFEQLNNKLDKILIMLSSKSTEQSIPQEIVAEAIQQPEEQITDITEAVKSPKKRSSKEI